jgi:LmbE family N-acetylglucosaminyl deacetylase
MLVIAPHPDDEVLGAGGLMQRVRGQGGAIRIVYLTDGEGYREGVEAEDRLRRSPSVSEYREYGRRRQGEARAAVQRLGIESDALTFLGFPNNGLGRMMTSYWSEHRRAFVSPYTRRNRPYPSEIIVSDTEYRGEDLTQELAQIIGTYRPTLIVAPRKEDQHVDHCAAWYFVADALVDVRRVHQEYRHDLVNYIVHYYSWPFSDVSDRMPPPDDLDPGPTGWLDVELTAEQAQAKRESLERYESQMRVMNWFLLGFARKNEVFSRPPSGRVALPLHDNPCQWLDKTGRARRR